MKKKDLCPCGSGKTYEKCCKIFHEGKPPMHAKELMRSRYSAYVLNLPEYIMQTTHPKNIYYQNDKKAWTEAINDFSLHTQFEKLEILSSTEEGNHGTVIFVAHLSQNNQSATFTEKSDFEKINGRWAYLQGEIACGVVPLSYFEKKH